MKKTKYASRLLEKVHKEILMLDINTDDLRFKIKHSFKQSGCLPCQKQKERDIDEGKNKK